MILKCVWPLMAVTLSACNQDEGFINNKSPFFQHGYVMPKKNALETLDKIKKFAIQNKLSTKYSEKHFKSWEFSITIIGKNINISIDNVAKGDVAWISAVSRYDANEQDKELLYRLTSSVGLIKPIGGNKPPLISP